MSANWSILTAFLLSASSSATDPAVYLRCVGQLAVGANGEKVEPFWQIYRFSENPDNFSQYWPHQRIFSDFCDERSSCFVNVDDKSVSVSYTWDAPKESRFTHTNLRLEIDRFTGIMWQSVEDISSSFVGGTGEHVIFSRTDAKCEKIDNPATAKQLF